jgi:sensor histidine kinase YesM
LEGRIPSLLLQPIVENAIKYAVTPMEAGAEIHVDARVMGERLIITITDTGPGLGEAPLQDELPVTTSGTGVGLANIRDRLQQAYGSDQRFEIAENVPHGLIVLVDIPYQNLDTRPISASVAAATTPGGKPE